MSDNKIIDFLVIGFLCHDQIPGGYQLGGTAAYASQVATCLGLKTGVLTSYGDDFLYEKEFTQRLACQSGRDILVRNKPANQTTVFKNTNLENGTRIQSLLTRGNDLIPSDLNDQWRTTPLVLLGPIANEVDYEFLQAFDQTLIDATLQGWLRRWDNAGKISVGPMDWSQLTGLDVVILSDADITGLPDALAEIRRAVPLVVYTQGARGVTIYRGEETHHFPAYPVTPVDTTGAGDVLATVFLIYFQRTKDLTTAVAYAVCAASIIVEYPGLGGLLAFKDLDNRVSEFRRQNNLNELK